MLQLEYVGFCLAREKTIAADSFLRVVFPTHHSVLQLVVEDRMRVAKAERNTCAYKIKDTHSANCLEKEPRTPNPSGDIVEE
mmetsp:Transcript_11707/g.27825  ORF Transcript_11707/g.27825 Transcript_11707/m.27825 type:complete len:82 (+) Transcript_11707:258-503(+)